MGRIALIEDHSRLAGLLRSALAASGIEADVFGRIDSSWPLISASRYDAAVIDRGLPDGDGLDLVRRLRANGQRMPCLMLTARDALHDRVNGLEAGADDYLVKPFSMEELVARVRALMRRAPTLQSLSPEFGGLVVHAEHATMAQGGESVTLAPAELQIILCLTKAAGQLVRRSTLEAAAWGLDDPVTPNAFDVAMHRLRKKLVMIAAAVQITNQRGYGYALRTSMPGG